MTIDTEAWVLVGDWHVRKVYGPFPSPDAARDFCNKLGMPEIQWAVEPLFSPSPLAG